MSQTRHTFRPRSTALDGSILVRTFGVTFTETNVIKAHTHKWDQLTYATQGVMSVVTAGSTWVAPPHRAVWVPAGVEHSEIFSGPVKARSLYIVPKLSRFPRASCVAMNVSPLLRELILKAIEIGSLDDAAPTQSRLIDVILDQFEALATVPIQLKSPTDPRARRIAEWFETDPSLEDGLATLARRAGASTRTVERLFRAETGVSFQQWRQRLRLIHALKLLASGESVTNVALEAGYSSTSAFIAMFRRELHTTPRQLARPRAKTP
jgi:AraC-like DNA-binding protein/quercetin dioxygenase-like cupin family protein